MATRAAIHWSGGIVQPLPQNMTFKFDLSPAEFLDIFTNRQANNASLARIEQLLIAAFAQEKKQMAAMDEAIQTLTDQVSANTTVIGSAKALISGFNQKLADAIAAAQAAGATPAQLKAVTDLSSAVKSSDDELAQAIVDNTPVVTA